MSSTQTLHLGPHEAAIRTGYERLRAQRVVARLWQQDPSLWSSEPAVQTTIRNRLGWLTIASVMRAHQASVAAFPQELFRDGLRHVVLLGMGGSGLFTEVCRQTFGISPQHLDVTVLDTTDPTAIRAQQQRCEPRELCVIVSSKSGSTSEISALSKYFYDVLKCTESQPGQHLVVITDVGTSLEEQAAVWKARRVFAHGRGTGQEVGGRFSALTYFGLVPASLMGVDATRLLSRAEQMFSRCGSAVAVEENPGAVLGTILGTFAQAGRDKLTLLCAPPLASFGTWVEQLIAESTGKLGKGIAPIHGEPLRDIARYGTDRVFVELQLVTEPDRVLTEHVNRLIAAGHPVVRIRWEDRYDLGEEVAKWEVATALASVFLDINPFDEPNVKESKDRTKVLLEEYGRTHRLPEEPALLRDGDCALIAAPEFARGTTLRQCLGDYFARLRAHEYVSLLSFLPRTPTLDQILQAMRECIAQRLEAATMLGFGPRYLHSTGQLFKGGPDEGLFLFLTSDEPQDLAIPGEAFTFGVLKHAQVLGDFQAMQQRGRRVLRVHLRGHLDRVIQQLLNTVDETLTSAARQ